MGPYAVHENYLSVIPLIIQSATALLLSFPEFFSSLKPFQLVYCLKVAVWVAVYIVTFTCYKSRCFLFSCRELNFVGLLTLGTISIFERIF